MFFIEAHVHSFDVKLQKTGKFRQLCKVSKYILEILPSISAGVHLKNMLSRPVTQNPLVL
jgi:hypothetical protein